MDSLDDLLVEEILQSRTGDKLDRSKVSDLCHRINERKIGGGACKVVRAAKRNISAKDPAVQLRALMLLDVLVSNCQTAIHDVASESVVDDILNVISHGLAPAANQEKANQLVKQLAEHIQVPSERLPSKGAHSDKLPSTSSSLKTSPHSLRDTDFQQTCRNGIQGLLKDLTSSPQNEAHHIQKWLEAFSKRLLSRAEGVSTQVQGLLENTGLVELELHNAFNSFRGLSSSQFVENLVYEVDELEIANEDPKITERGMPSQSYENDIVPRYKEAVATAWRVYEQHICKSSAGASSFSNGRKQSEQWRKQVPHIIGTEDFMRDNSCGLAEDRSFGLDISDFESDTERDGAAEIVSARTLREGEGSESESEVVDEQVGGFKPSVSAALDFKAMLEAALRSPYIPPTSKVTVVDHLQSNLVAASNTSTASTAITTAADQFQRNVSKEGHGALHSADSSMEPHGQEQVSKLVDVVSKPIPQHAEIPKLRNLKESIFAEATTMISNDVSKDFYTSMMAGGLFDDENEDSNVFGLQSENIWSHTAVSSDAGTQIEHKKKEIGDFLALEPDKTKSEHGALFSPTKPSMFLARSYEHAQDSLFANESTSSLTFKDTLSFLRKGLFEDDEGEETENGDLFGPSNGAGIASSSKEIHGTDLGELMGQLKGVSSRSNDSIITNAESVHDSSESTGMARGTPIDFQNNAACSEMPGSVTRKSETGSTNNDNLEGLSNRSREEFSFSSLKPLPETRRKLEKVGSVPIAQLVAHGKNNPERILGYTNYRSELPTEHISNREKIPNVESGDDMSSWSSASSTTDPLNVAQSCVEASLTNGVKPEESEHQTGNLEGLADHPTHLVGGVADSSHSEFLTNIVTQQYGEEYGKCSTIIVEPIMARMTSSGEEANEEPRNLSSNWSRKITSLQEHFIRQHSMFSIRQKRNQKTELGTSVADVLEENSKSVTVQTQRTSPQSTSQDMNSLHHATMSRPRGPKRRAPTSRQSASPLLMTHTHEINGGSSPEEEFAERTSSDFMVKEHDSIGKTETVLRTDDAATSEEKINGGTDLEKCASNDRFSTVSNIQQLTKSSKKATEVSKFSTQESQEGLLNTLLFKEDGQDTLFGPLQGLGHSNSSGTAPLSKSKLSQGLPPNGEGSTEGEFPGGVAVKVPDQTFQERSFVEHQLSPRKYFRRSLFDDDEDDNENDTNLFT